MGAGGDADPGFPAVRDYLPAPAGGHVADFNGFGQASDAADVRLGDVHFSPVHQVGESSGGLPFSGGDADAAFVVHPCVAVEVVHPERGFEKIDVEFAQSRTVASAWSALPQAYWTSTIRVKSGPTACGRRRVPR